MFQLIFPLMQFPLPMDKYFYRPIYSMPGSDLLLMWVFPYLE
uniref:ORF41b n=1 Tax=Pinus koraiensis TaxID=88728 RepID=A4QMK7_PINKO|nr:ORF41b [Pinus koraiensis]ABP35316.1 ORF41b [Pinus koraiensis]